MCDVYLGQPSCAYRIIYIRGNAHKWLVSILQCGKGPDLDAYNVGKISIVLGIRTVTCDRDLTQRGN